MNYFVQSVALLQWRYYRLNIVSLWRINSALDLQSSVESPSAAPSLHFQRRRYQNISFVDEGACFVLHVASKSDKVRVTRSSLCRSRKCCCEHQLLLRSARAARGLGLPRLLPNKESTVFVEDGLPARLLFKRWWIVPVGKMRTFSHKGDEGCHLKEHYLHSVAALWLTQSQHLSAARSGLLWGGVVSDIWGLAPDTSSTNGWRLPWHLSLTTWQHRFHFHLPPYLGRAHMHKRWRAIPLPVNSGDASLTQTRGNAVEENMIVTPLAPHEITYIVDTVEDQCSWVEKSNIFA